MGKYIDNWQRCPRCDSVKTTYRGSRLQFLIVGVILFLAGYFYGLPFFIGLLYSINDALILGAEDIISSSSVKTGVIIALILVPFYNIVKPLHSCKDCNYMWG